MARGAARVGAGIVCTLGLVGLGVFLGGFLGGRVFGGGGMGWDQLADALGGSMIGILAAIVAAIWAIRKLDVKQQALLGVGAWALAAAAAAVIRALQP
ncbi:MAG: hypothetical protein MJB57_15600 [Gemmatimonadetes bacterium]|nr:hypothetical protein [Gemmatimonadota bacterium]